MGEKRESEMKSQTKKLKELTDTLNIQGQNGNWNYDPYMMGLYNGMEMARSIFAENEPVFKNKPERWLHDKTIIGRIKYWWMVRFTQTEKARE